ncbi:beta strand repeat-containing protein, partial [Burkholderia sp. WSM2232]|uniref:beta strand repeat-containing protein n=1 Tax=Burkholderia sp. WSM2232 TaxID=944436 RepID=UPI0004834CA5
MNKNRFRRVFSKRLGMLVAVAENVTSQGKQAGESSGVSTSGRELGVVSTMSAVALALVAFHPSVSRAQSLPTNGQVMAGQASISQNTNTMTINQGTQRTVIDWNSFNVGAGNTVQFNQPNAQAQALNRVTGGIPSNIQGSLLANGQVLIQNANGVLFSKGAVVNVGSLLATTKSIDANQFMAGGPLDLKSTGTNASVVNDGSIQAQGFVTLMGDQARNTGTITTAPGGQVVLAAGDSATVALPNGQGIQLTLTNATANALVENSGTINAQNGTVLLTARGSNTLLNTVVNLSGVTRAGTVVADAGNTGDVAVTGTIDVSNAAAGGVGGTVVLSGDRVGVFGNATIDASGDAAGGKVIIGGDSLKKLSGTSAAGMLQDGVTFANFTQVDAGASINAGSAHGDGGFVETSGHSLDVQGTVSAAAPNGKAGEWLIDPTDVTISTGADANYSGSVTGGFSGGSNTSATVKNTTISNALNAGTDVTITTASSGTATGNIVQQAGADITKTAGGAANLTLAANGSITLNGNITSTSNKLNLNLTAAMGTNNGSVTQSGGKTIDLNGGNLTISGNTAAITGTAVSLSGNVLNVGGGAITGAANASTAVYFGGNFTETGNGTLAISGAAINGGGVTFDNGNFTVSQNSTVNVTGTSVNGPGIQTGWNNSTITVKDSAKLNFNGTSTNGSGTLLMSGQGTYAHGGSTNVQDSAVFNISGSSTAGVGVQLGQPNTRDFADIYTSGNGTLNILGNSQSGMGVYGIANYTGIDNSTLNITGASNTGFGVSFGLLSVSLDQDGRTTYDSGYVASTWNVSGHAVMNVNGTSNTSTGVADRSSYQITDEGAVNIVGEGGTAGYFAGRDFGGSYNNSANVSGNGTLNITGTGNTAAGVYMQSVNVSDNGTVNINGSSQQAAGVDHANTTVISATGDSTVNISGQSANGTGVYVANGTIDGNAGININGTSSSGDGVIAESNNSLNVSGNGTANISGNSTNGNGAVIDGTVNVTDNGTVNISGGSTNGTG